MCVCVHVCECASASTLARVSVWYGVYIRYGLTHFVTADGRDGLYRYTAIVIIWLLLVVCSQQTATTNRATVHV